MQDMLDGQNNEIFLPVVIKLLGLNLYYLAL